MKLSQPELTDRIGASQSTVSAWESDQSQPRIKYLDPLAKELGVSVSDLLEDSSANILNQNGNSNQTIHGTGHTVYAENQLLLQELLTTQRELLALQRKQMEYMEQQMKSKP